MPAHPQDINTNHMILIEEEKIASTIQCKYTLIIVLYSHVKAYDQEIFLCVVYFVLPRQLEKSQEPACN